MIDIDIADEYRALIAPEVIERAALAALTRQHASPHAGLSLVVAGDAQIRELNLAFMGNPDPTDVLSFPSGDTTPDAYLGDIIISLPRAQAQAAQGGHPLAQEIELLTVHGTLHLLGHDHAGDADKARMWAAQAEILALLGNPLTP
jgi:probable rRNA maturation factor